MSAIAAMSRDGIIALDVHKGSVNGDVFLDFVRGSLSPKCKNLMGWQADPL